MGCYFPLRAWRLSSGDVVLREPSAVSEFMRLPCGGCIGCRMQRAQDWAIRCVCEWREHRASCWATLTYAPECLPPTLVRGDVSAYVKRLRSRVREPLRFFAAGEYGERNGRPHYHVILFGLERSNPEIAEAWGLGQVRVDPLSHAAIAYVAGYSAKKVGWREEVGERCDPETGEVFEYQPPFLQMSRRPGIGAATRDRHYAEFARSCVSGGREVPAPVYFRREWQKHATEEDVLRLKADLELVKADRSYPRRMAGFAIAQKRLAASAERREL